MTVLQGKMSVKNRKDEIWAGAHSHACINRESSPLGLICSQPYKRLDQDLSCVVSVLSHWVSVSFIKL